MDITKYLNNNDFRKRTGLLNVGATCYINTLIQCLLSCPVFREFIISKDYFNRIRWNLLKAVKKRVLTTERPIACLLSGGLDSSLISMSVKKYIKGIERIPSFSKKIAWHGFEQYYHDIYYRFWTYFFL